MLGVLLVDTRIVLKGNLFATFFTDHILLAFLVQSLQVDNLLVDAHLFIAHYRLVSRARHDPCHAVVAVFETGLMG